MLGAVREEEERPEAKGDEGTEDEEEDKLLREPQGRSVVGEGRGARGQGGYPAPRERQKSLRGHILTFSYQAGNMERGNVTVLSCRPPRLSHCTKRASSCRREVFILGMEETVSITELASLGSATERANLLLTRDKCKGRDEAEWPDSVSMAISGFYDEEGLPTPCTARRGMKTAPGAITGQEVNTLP